MKRRFILTNTFILAGCALIFATSATLMWFNNNVSIVPSQIVGSSDGAYYASGDGSETNPYVINKPRHLYNLAWLQYLGMYNKDSDGTVNTTYFKIEGTEDSNGNSVLDMSGWTLPPIGTEDNPFVGILDGNGTIVKNLTVSNTFSDYGTTHPYYDANGDELNESTFSKPQIIGFFGVVGGIDDKTYAYSSIENVELVEDLYLDNLTIQNANDSSSDKKVLAGLLAGYVNAPIKNCGVGYGEFNFANGTTNIASTVGETSVSKVSEYSLIGAYNPNKFSWEGKAGGSDKGQGQDWGGSIDLSSLSKRINYIAKSANGGNTPVKYTEYKKFNASLYYYSRGFDWSDTYQYGQYVALQTSTFLPLNIDLSKATISGTYTGNMGSYYTSGSNTAEPILETNTGYITGKLSTGSATPRLHNKTYDSSSATNGINYSVYQTDKMNTNYSTTKSTISSTVESEGVTEAEIYDIFQPKNISLFYVDTSTGTSYRIEDDDNKVYSDWSTTNGSTKSLSECGFGDLKNGYYKVKYNLSKMLSEEQTDTILNAKTINLNALQLFGPTSNTMSKSTYSTVTLNKKTYSSFEMLNGGINFELADSGSVKIVLGAYATAKSSTGVNSVLPSVYKVNRSSDNTTIESYKKINKIYQSGNTYYYEYSDDTSDTKPSDAKQVFDLTTLYNGAFKQKSAYYIEIPLNAGDYWFGADDTKNMASFILYLDIGANAGDDGGDSGDTTTSDIDFVYYDNKTLKKISDTGYKNSEVLFDLGSSTSGLIAFKRTYSDSSSIVYYYPLTGSGITVVGTTTNASGTDEKIKKND